MINVSTQELVEALATLVSLGAILLVVYGPWQTLCEDRARQHLFEARAMIFDLAADGRLSFDSEEYREIRRALNCLIRYTHQLTWPRFLTCALFIETPESGTMITDYIKRIDDASARLAVERQIGKSMNALILLIIHRSPVLWLICVPLWAVLRPLRWFSSEPSRERRTKSTRGLDQRKQMVVRRLQIEAESCCGAMPASH